MRILVAEDAKDLNRLIVKTLTKAGYSVDGCFNGEEALDYVDGVENSMLSPFVVRLVAGMPNFTR